MLNLVTAVVCDSASALPPYTLKGVRKKWQTPPASICVYLEIFNFTGDPYDVSAELWRRSTKVLEFYQELILMTRRDRDEVVLRLPLSGLDSKTYSLRILLNQTVADTIWLDFGHPEAAI